MSGHSIHHWRQAALALILGLGAALVGARAAAAEGRVYQGAEAQALKCAWIISAGAGVLQDADIISSEERGISIAISARMLTLYVSGTDRQKLAAFEEVHRRSDKSTAINAFQRQARACIQRFPVD